MGGGRCPRNIAMPKFWVQYSDDAGGYIPWEANTPPTPESCFRARFLSQFAAWIKYLSAIDESEPGLNFPCGNERCDKDHSFIYPAKDEDIESETRHIGTIIQTASFWQQLNWKPSERWLNIKNEDVAVGAILEAPMIPLIDTEDYAETEINDIEIGEVIQPRSDYPSRLREYLWRIRRRIDLCGAIRKELPTFVYGKRLYEVWGYTGDKFEVSNYTVDEDTGGWIQGFWIWNGYFSTGQWSEWNRHKYVPITITVVASPCISPDAVSCSFAYYTSAVGAWQYEDFWGDGIREPNRKVLEAFMMAVGGEFDVPTTFRTDQYPPPITEDRMCQYYMDCIYHPLEYPFIDYLPQNDLFNDHCNYQLAK